MVVSLVLLASRDVHVPKSSTTRTPSALVVMIAQLIPIPLISMPIETFILVLFITNFEQSHSKGVSYYSNDDINEVYTCIY